MTPESPVDEIRQEFRAAHEEFQKQSNRLMCLVLETAHSPDDENVSNAIREQREAVSVARDKYMEVRRRYFRAAFPEFTTDAAGAGELLRTSVRY